MISLPPHLSSYLKVGNTTGTISHYVNYVTFHGHNDNFFASIQPLSLTCAHACPQLIRILYLSYHHHEPSNTTTHLYISQGLSHSLNLPNTGNDMLGIFLSRCVDVHIQKRRYYYVGMEKEVLGKPTSILSFTNYFP